jgi:hypothetical protein
MQMPLFERLVNVVAFFLPALHGPRYHRYKAPTDDKLDVPNGESITLTARIGRRFCRLTRGRCLLTGTVFHRSGACTGGWAHPDEQARPPEIGET